MIARFIIARFDLGLGRMISPIERRAPQKKEPWQIEPYPSAAPNASGGVQIPTPSMRWQPCPPRSIGEAGFSCLAFLPCRSRGKEINAPGRALRMKRATTGPSRKAPGKILQDPLRRVDGARNAGVRRPFSREAWQLGCEQAFVPASSLTAVASWYRRGG